MIPCPWAGDEGSGERPRSSDSAGLGIGNGWPPRSLLCGRIRGNDRASVGFESGLHQGTVAFILKASTSSARRESPTPLQQNVVGSLEGGEKLSGVLEVGAEVEVAEESGLS